MSLGFMELRRLGYFVAVVEQRGFRGAALKLHLSQPPLTRQIRHLEESLGVTLLTRGPGGTQPTQAGLLLYEEARNMLRLAEQAADRVRMLGKGQMGRLDVGVFGSAVIAATGIFPRRVAMNEDTMKGKWKQLSGKIKAKWGDLTDDDISRGEGDREYLFGKLQEKYGLARDKAEQHLKDMGL